MEGIQYNVGELVKSDFLYGDLFLAIEEPLLKLENLDCVSVKGPVAVSCCGKLRGEVYEWGFLC